MAMGWMLLYYTLELFKWLIIIRAVMSWFVSPLSSNPIVNGVRRATDPILQPIASALPNFGGVDLSPLIAYGIVWLLQSLLVRSVLM